MALKLFYAHLEILHNNESLGLALESSHSGTWDWDISNNTFTWSPQFLKLFEMPADTIAGFGSWRKAVHPDDLDEAGRKIEEAVEQKSDLLNEYRILLADGTIRWIRATGRAYYVDGIPKRMIGLCLDFTDEKRRAEELEKSEGLYQALFRNLLNGFAYCQMLFSDGEPIDFIYLAVNEAFIRQTGLNDVVGKRVSQIIPDIPKYDHELLVIYGRVSTSGEPERFTTYVTSLEKWFVVSVYCPERGYFVSIFDVLPEQGRDNAPSEPGLLS